MSGSDQLAAEAEAAEVEDPEQEEEPLARRLHV